MATKEKSNLYLTGKLLLAMPNMGDPRFHKAVIFICAHDENGAMGLAINHAVPDLEFLELLEQLKIHSDTEEEVEKISVPVLSGGPVESARGFLLHSGDFKQKDTIKIGNRYGITGTVDALKEIASGNGPEQLLLILGYAGWSPGQLEREIQDNAWLVAEADPEIIFSAPTEEKWTLAINTLGINPAMFSGAAGRA